MNLGHELLEILHEIGQVLLGAPRDVDHRLLLLASIPIDRECPSHGEEQSGGHVVTVIEFLLEILHEVGHWT
jgi:hypothetical protein